MKPNPFQQSAAQEAPAGGGKRARVGDLLLAEGLISQEQLDKALTAQKQTSRMLGEVLVEQGVISQASLVHE